MPVSFAVSVLTAAVVEYMCWRRGVASPDNAASVVATDFAMQGLLGTFSTIPLIWSLSVELFFYTLMGVTTAAAGRLGLRALFALSISCTLFATLSHVAKVQAAVPQASVPALTHLGYCAFHTTFLLVGAVLYRSSGVRLSAVCAGPVALALLIHLAALWLDHCVSAGGATGTAPGDALAALAIFLAAMALRLRWRALRPFLFFGDVSYSPSPRGCAGVDAQGGFDSTGDR